MYGGFMLSSKEINILIEAAQLYKNNLLNMNVMFIHYNKKTHKYSYSEMLFEKKNFLHLTGIQFIESEEENKKSVLFYNKCINNKLSKKDILPKQNGTTVLKLEIIRVIMNLHTNTSMIGEYNYSKPKLIVDKICGGVYASLGIDKGDNGLFLS